MNFLDCLDNEHLAAPAVAVCTGCGAAVCRQHLALTPRHERRIGAMGREDQVEPSARTARCRTCQQAVDATSVLPAAPLRLFRRPTRRGRS